MSESTRVVVLVLLLAACATSCRRRVPGTCADHVDCEAGFDCVSGRCVRREGIPGQGATAPPAAPKIGETAPAAEAPASVSPVTADAGVAPVPVPAPRKPPGPARPAPAEPATSPPPPLEKLPLWKERRKNG